MTGILPEKIAQRKTKGRPKEAILRALSREWSRLRPMFEDARVCERGYMNLHLSGCARPRQVWL